MTRKQYRMVWILSVGVVLFAAVGLTLFALRSGISYAMSPSELKVAQINAGDKIRLFGLVKEGSVKKSDGLEVTFELTDLENSVSVVFNDILPDLFREKQGIITEGQLDQNGVFVAETVLAKHDENYVPRELADTLKEKGLWQEPEAN